MDDFPVPYEKNVAISAFSLELIKPACPMAQRLTAICNAWNFQFAVV